MNRTVRHIAGILLILYIISVGILCLIQTDSFPAVAPEWLGIPVDKIVHFVMFLPYPILTWLVFNNFTTILWKRFAFAALILISGFAIAGATELLQGLTEYRSADVMDLLSDTAGIITGMGIVGIITYKARKK